MGKTKTSGVTEFIGRMGTKGAGEWGDVVGKSMGKGVVEGVRESVRPLFEQEIGPFWKKLHKEFPETARETVKQVASEARDIGSRAVRGLSVPVALGAGTGAIAAPEDQRGAGALRGAAGGLGGGLIGAAWGRKVPAAAAQALTIGGSLLGGAGLGASLRHGGSEPQERKKPMKNKHAGVTLDWYDDKGATLKAVFPTLESLPDVIKTAAVCPQENLNNEDFALITLDEGHVMRKFACHDAGTTAMSVVYFMEHGDKLPENAQKVAAANLVMACGQFNMRPPAALVKIAGPISAAKDILLPAAGGAAIGGLSGYRFAEGDEHRWRSALAGALLGAAGGAGIGAFSARIRGAPTGRARGFGHFLDVAEPIAGRLGALSAGGAGGGLAGELLTRPVEKRKTVGFSKEDALRAVIMADLAEGRAIGATPGQQKREYRALVKKPGRLVVDKKGPVAGMKTATGFGGGTVGFGESESQKEASDILAGGKADDKTNSDFNQSQLAKGRKIEMEHTKSPQVAEEIARDHLEEFPKDYYTRLEKMESKAKKEKQANVVDITGKSPAPKFKVASPAGPEDYAVVLDGKGYYPIHTWDLVKKAEVYYQEEKGRMQPEVRRQYATKLASRAASMGYPLDPDIQEAGSKAWASSGHLKAAVEMRKIACQPHSEDRKFLDELFEKRASVEPDTYAEVLRRFDVQRGLDKGWDRVILDPWASTFGLNKTADVVWEDGNDRVTSEDLQRLAANHVFLDHDFTPEMRKEFVKDPAGIFESLPLPMKKVVARLASDLPYQSESIAQ